MMPTNQQLGPAIRAGCGRLTLTEQRVPCQIHTLIIAQRSLAMNVLTIHRNLAEVMCECRNPKRKPVTRPKKKGLPQLISNGRDPPRVGVAVTLKLIGARGQVGEDL
jgi:hypothetical protein